MISEVQIDTLRSKNKNCILVVGGEPVITNHTITFCQKYFQQKTTNKNDVKYIQLSKSFWPKISC